LVKKAVIDGDIKAAAGFGVEETVEAVCFHKLGMSETDYMQSKRSVCRSCFAGGSIFLLELFGEHASIMLGQHSRNGGIV
jgi:hypothetical protein